MEQSGQTEGVSVCGGGGGRKNTGALCPSGLLNNTRALEAGSYYWLEDIKKNAPFKAHKFSTAHTHSTVDKILQVSGTALRERVDLWRPGGGLKHTADLTIKQREIKKEEEKKWSAKEIKFIFVWTDSRFFSEETTGSQTFLRRSWRHVCPAS